MKEYRITLDTQSGMWCLWNERIAEGVNSYDDWEERFYENEALVELINKSFSFLLI